MLKIDKMQQTQWSIAIWGMKTREKEVRPGIAPLVRRFMSMFRIESCLIVAKAGEESSPAAQQEKVHHISRFQPNPVAQDGMGWWWMRQGIKS
jgi:hypothetical protein